MNKFIVILVIVGVIFIAGKIIYDSYGNNIRKTIGLPDVYNKNASQGDYQLGNNPNGLQASSIERNSATQ